MEEKSKVSKTRRLLVKKCHMCGGIMAVSVEPKRCGGCKKSFLPMDYFHKVHNKEQEFDELYSHVEDLHEESLIVGLTILW